VLVVLNNFVIAAQNFKIDVENINNKVAELQQRDNDLLLYRRIEEDLENADN
jgi:hypothetical protein